MYFRHTMKLKNAKIKKWKMKDEGKAEEGAAEEENVDRRLAFHRLSTLVTSFPPLTD